MMKRPLQKISHRYFTLLEILVCFVLIGMMSGIVFGWSSSLVQQYRFRHSVQSVSSRLALCKEAAACYQTDIEVILTKTGKTGVAVTCKTWETIRPLQGFLYKKKIYPGIQQIVVDGRERETVSVQFFSNLCFPERITLCSEKGEAMPIDLRNLLVPTL